VRAGIGYDDRQKQTSAASLYEQAEKAEKLEPKGKRTGYDSPDRSYVNIAPPV
jgi:hypothetical protein